MKRKMLYSGLDVHKISIDVTVTDERTNGEVRSYDKIGGSLEVLEKPIQKLK